MKLAIDKRKFNFLMLLAIIIWYTVPIVQENGGMILIAALACLWFVTCEFGKRRISINFILTYMLMIFVLSCPLLFGRKYYGGINLVYFLCSSFLLFFPIMLFFYYINQTNKKENICIIAVFLIGLVCGIINTNVVLDQYPMASRLMATSQGDEYSKMGAGGFGFAYLLMITTPLLLKLVGKKNGIVKFAYLGIIVLIFHTLVKCEYTTCLLLLLLGIAIYALHNSHIVIGLFSVTVVVGIFLLGDNLEGFFLWLAKVFENTEVIAIRLKDVANGFSEGSLDAMDSSRYSLYRESFDGFMQRPLFGTAYGEELISGGHSTVLDTLSIYGVVGFAAVLTAFIIPLRTISVAINKDKTYSVVIILFAILSFLNPTIYIYQLGISIFFFAPLILNSVQRREESET